MVKVIISHDRLKQVVKPGDTIQCYLHTGRSVDNPPTHCKVRISVAKVEVDCIKGRIIHSEYGPSKLVPEFYETVKDKEISVSWDMIEEVVCK
ncbi:hypothetical protein [Paenibacillus sp. LK1]|uniref:hypothetical protein n=1 Tax=Paenibacillus sp. LK1 TaxID=2053014 RepID=UPI000C1A3595|nr:hypothetical protein [Paenibacillus sp. LK1]PIH61098.1 hypothetical protein CS562_01355 [Paenibacillus sp. LK1]